MAALVAFSLSLAIAGLPVEAETRSVERLLSTEVRSPQSVRRVCHDRLLGSGPGLVVREVIVPQAGLVRVDVDGSVQGDWVVGVFDAPTGTFVAGSASRGTREVAEGFVGEGQRLAVQACRYGGDADRAFLTVTSIPLTPADMNAKIQVVDVVTPSRADKERLVEMGFDLTESGGKDFIGVVLYGAEDAARLVAAGFTYRVVIPDLVAQEAANRDEDPDACALAVEPSALPSGSNCYRHLADVQVEMKALAQEYPTLVRPIRLRIETWEGRVLEGIEITKNAANVADGKPVFLMLGVHHAREWPSAEHTIEFGYDLLKNYGEDRRITELVNEVRTILIPVVNPDGFNLSREAPIDVRGAGVAGENGTTVAVLADPGFAYKRRNCNMVEPPSPSGEDCANMDNRDRGVDDNRNYGAFWGGPGASENPTSDTFRGVAPFSEPETRNIRRLVSTRQVVTLITNHSYSNLVLRPPGVRSRGPTPDEAALKDLGDRMAAQNGYTSQPGWGLYDTSGTTEDWSYWTTGGFGYTFEIGAEEFHPPYEDNIAEYVGHDEYAGKGNRAAFLLALENAADASQHSLLTGRAPPGLTLRLHKSFETLTDSGDTFTDTLDTAMTVPKSGRFRWHINPSTRPAAARDVIKTTLEDSPTKTSEFQPGSPLVPGAGNQVDGVTSEDLPFRVRGSDPRAGVKVSIDWTIDNNDWDLWVYLEEGGELVLLGSSLSGAGTHEEVLIEDAPRGNYVARVENWAAVDQMLTGKVEYFDAASTKVFPATVESWTLTCERPDRTVLHRTKVTIDRGQSRALDLRTACAA